MNALRLMLAVSALGIYAFTFLAISSQGWNWPAVAVNDLMALNWRTQFDFDFIIHLLMLASWVVWREGATAKAYVFGFLCVFMGGMFSFPYLIYATLKANSQPKAFLLGVHAQSREH